MSLEIQNSPSAEAQCLGRRDYLSFSSLSTFRQCSLKWYFKYVEGLPEPVTAASLVFGGAIHTGVEHHFRELLAGNDTPSLDSMLGAYHRGWGERGTTEVHFGRDEDRSSCDRLAERMFASFQASPFARPRAQSLGSKRNCGARWSMACRTSSPESTCWSTRVTAWSSRI